MIKNSFYLAIFSLISKGLAFFKILFVSNSLRIGIDLDYYFLLFVIIIILSELVGNSINTLFIVFFSSKKLNGIKNFLLYYSIFFFFSFILCVLIFFTFPHLISFFSPNFIYQNILYYKDFFLYASMIIFTTINSFFLVSYYHSKFSFILPSIFHSLSSVPVIVVLFFFSTDSLYMIILFSLLGTLLECLFLFLFLPFKKQTYLSSMNNYSNVTFTIRDVFFVVLSNLLYLLSAPILLFFSSNYYEGFISEINISNKIIGLFSSIFVSNIITIYYPRFTKSRYSRITLKLEFFKATFQMVSILFPISVFLFYYNSNIIYFLFPAISISSQVSVSYILSITSFSLIFFGMFQLTIKLLNSLEKFNYSFFLNFLHITIYLSSLFILTFFYGYKGVPISITISLIILIIILAFLYKTALLLFIRHYFLRLLLIIFVTLLGLSISIFMNSFFGFFGFIEIFVTSIVTFTSLLLGVIFFNLVYYHSLDIAYFFDN